MDSLDNPCQTPIGEAVTISCDRCRRRKIKCDRQKPCSKCEKAGVACSTGGSGEKKRPARKGYVQALEAQVASLRHFIRRLRDTTDPTKRDELLAQFESPSPSLLSPPESSQGLVLARIRTGQLKRLRNRNAAQFYGGTSFFHIPLAEESLMSPSNSDSELDRQPVQSYELDEACLQLTPEHETTKTLMSFFFREQYQYNMCVYREYFLNDYHSGQGRYYSELLLYAICAMGALADTQEFNRTQLSKRFSAKAQSLVYASLEDPSLTTLQALVLLAQVEIGHGRNSKGWLLSGMAFRLAHEMGLHLDPKNWDDATAPGLSVDQEILRRVYWATFIVDTQLSLYFGRPPALFPEKSDVDNAIRLPYPSCWEAVLNTYIARAPPANTSNYEDGVAFVGSFIYRVELYKIMHTMITDVFENRREKPDNTLLVHRTQALHASLTKWASELPGKLHWTQWSVGEIPACVLHLHMLYHTSMIILHRLPRSLLEAPGISSSEDVQVCYESLDTVIRLLKTFGRFHSFSSLPLDTVYILSVATGAVFMKRILENASFQDDMIAKPLSLLLRTMEQIRGTWPCVGEIKEGIMRHINTTTQESGETGNGLSMQGGLTPEASFFPDLTMGFEDGDWGFLAQDPNLGTMEAFARDLGLLDTEFPY